ncbi:redoxin domain-containing protein [Siphonobacter aquaeclarae]|uniref:Thiol-disulfide isomerase or thioredoxin n=1 Tax=Siphonobacter aquaeclarae TaxID=563176 RepID=A0A1G9L020_9BACT|nr:redoxin domain-containing protein [Siphonobacter aquaeclarae]SDL55331.1 Thiol-disulfide isomerase or thioredoxin [Siphonobacter aquaeclarae]
MRFLLFAILLTVSGSAFAQTGYRIAAQVRGLRDSTCYLAYYTGLGKGQFFVQDTAKADAQGTIIFEGKKKLDEGLYVISIAQWRLFDVVVDADQHFELVTDVESVRDGNPPRRMKVTGSKENELFYSFNQQMQNRFDQAKALSEEQKAHPDPAKAEKLKALQKEMGEFRKQFIKTNTGSLTAKFFQAAAEPEIPPAPLLPNGRPDSTFSFRYYKQHYLDGLDLTDDRLLRTPFIQQKLDYYFENLVYQVPDSLTKEADRWMAKAKGRDMRRFIAYRITSTYEQSKLVGVEGMFVHMGEKYYLGEPALWDTSTVSNFRQRIAVMKPLLVGKVIPNMYQTDTTGKELTLHDLPATYTVLLIYSDDCGHCRDAMPHIKTFYQKYKSRGVRIFATDLRRSKEDWLKFIREFGIQEFTNGIDIHKDANGKTVYYTDYLKTFDAQSTPTIYILDKDKKIVARKIPAEELDRYFAFLLEQQAKKGKS